MRYQAPKGITEHPAVETCTSGDAAGSDYKHDVWLKDGWRFKYGRMAGCQGAFFHTVRDFKDAEPIRRPH
jgi:hypothetical protein